MLLSRKSKWFFVVTSVVFVIDSVLGAVNTYYLAKVLECAEAGSAERLLNTITICAVLLAVMYANSLVIHWCRLKFLTNACWEMQNGIMKNLLLRPLRIFRKQNDAYYMNLLTNDIDTYRSKQLNIYPYFISCIALVAADAFLLWRINQWMCIIGFALAWIPMATSNLFTKMTQKYTEASSKASEQFTGILKENIEGFEAVRIDNNPDSFLKNFSAASMTQQKKRMASVFANAVSSETMFSTAKISQLVCLGVGGWLAIRGQLSVVMLFAASSYFVGISNGFNNIVDYFIEIRSAKPILKKLISERDTGNMLTVNADAGADTAADGRKSENAGKAAQGQTAGGENVEAAPIVAYERVSFSFGDRQLYHDFNYQFQSGGCYVVIGESGSGKSTLVKLLLKFYDDYTGNVKLCGKDIREMTEQEIYRHIGVVNQSPFLFNASLYDNITMYSGTPEKDSEEYSDLLNDLNLAELAERVGDEPLGDFGDNISGGERQRISMARALRKHSEIMIFDEPTTGLDPANVTLINEFIFRHKEMTRIVISHDWRKEYLERFDGVIEIG